MVEPEAPTKDKMRLKSFTVRAIIKEVVRNITCWKNMVLDCVVNKSCLIYVNIKPVGECVQVSVLATTRITIVQENTSNPNN